MDIKDLALDDLLDQQSASDNHIKLVKADNPAEQVSGEVAIIGVSARIGAANNLDAFWQMLANGESGTRELPPARRVAFEEYLHLRGVFHRISEQDYLRETFLDQIDQFDYRFFGLSKQEANLMDPNQRLFLQTGWAALEDAGYGGTSIRGSKTGVFVGFSADFGQDYRHIIHTFAPDAPEIAVAGNVKSIVASRLAYQLDLRGPTMMIDTACSSGLVCVHQAVRSIRNNECDMAIAGAVKIDFLPVMDKDNIGVGTKDIQDTIAADERTKTFDDFSDGTSAAEGVIAYVLKGYEQAVQDGDNILGIVAGSAINQDGLSVGITAPNSDAQARLIQDALQDAKTEPEHISYIEAHGTATRLGDPIEIAGVSKAFSRFTQRKQFCAIGSVKTNIGHMDNGAGLAGLTKVLLAFQHEQLPPSLNFHTPNRNIPFEQSPVYVNDVLSPWAVPAGQPRIAGINSFGLSGTNCHVIVKQAPAREAIPPAKTSSSQLLLLSGTTPEALTRQVNNFIAHFQSEAGKQQPWQHICYTAAVGRMHHSVRLAVIADGHASAIHSLEAFLAASGESQQGKPEQKGESQQNKPEHKEAWHYQQFKLVPQLTNSANACAFELSEAQQQQLSQQADNLLASPDTSADSDSLTQLQTLWAQGANPDWQRWFEADSSQGANCCRVSLPTYPFAQESCWVEATVAAERALNQGVSAKTFNHPLLDQCVADSFGFHLYKVNLSARQHWELSEHIVKGVCVLPGTCYIEIMLQVALQLRGAHYHDHPWPVVFERIQFLSPFRIFPKENRDLHIQAQEKDHGRYSIYIVSRDDKGINAHARDLEWEVHAEAILRLEHQTLDITRVDPPLVPETLIDSFAKRLLFSRADDVRKGLEIGDRWNHSFVDGWYQDDMSQFMVKLALPEPYRHEGDIYAWHPALLDVAVNAANHMLGDGDLFLPFSYKHFTVMSKLPEEVFVLFATKNATDELYTFDIQLMDSQGTLCGRVDEYTIKRVPEDKSFDQAPAQPQAFALRAVNLQQDDGNTSEPGQPDSLQALNQSLTDTLSNEPVLFIHTGQAAQTRLLNNLKHQLGNVLALELKQELNQEPEQAVRDSLQALLQQNRGQAFSAVLYAGALTEGFDKSGVMQLSQSLCLIKACVNALVQEKVPLSGGCFVLTVEGVTAPLDDEVKYQVEPDQAAIAAFVRIAGMENPQLRLACLDINRQQLGGESLNWFTGAIMPKSSDAPEKRSQLVWQRGETAQSRFGEQLEILNLEAKPQFRLRDNGVYVITGGTGALGLELALAMGVQFSEQNSEPHLDQKPTLKLALVSSSEFPDPAHWGAILNGSFSQGSKDNSDQAQQVALQNKIRTLQTLQRLGIDVQCHTADLADEQAVASLLNALRTQHQRINGIVHAAGRAGAGYLVNKTDQQLQQVVNGKALGAWHLHQHTLGDELQFFVLYSSIATVLRNPGQSDYTAANSFLDGLAQYRRDQGLPALSVCWPAWRETGIAVQWNAVDEDEFFAPINTSHAISLLASAMHSSEQLPASIVLADLNRNAALTDLQQLGIVPSTALERFISLKSGQQSLQNKGAQSTTGAASGNASPDVAIKGISDPDEIDLQVAGAWRTVLGMAEFEYEENIKDLGANSILTTQLYKEFDRLYPGMIEMADLFSLTTIKSQAAQLRKALGLDKVAAPPAAEQTEEKPSEESMDDILAKLASGELSAEEAQNLL